MTPPPEPGSTGRHSLFALLVALAGIALTVGLGNWQTRRAEFKASLAAQWDAVQEAAPRTLDAADLAPGRLRLPARVAIRGRFRHDLSVALDNRSHEGRAGFWIVTPLVVGAGAVVLVDRGWVARDPADRGRLPAIAEPAGEVAVDGVALAELPRHIELGRTHAAGPLPAIWQNLDLDAYRRASGLAVASFVVQQTGPDDGGLARGGFRPDYGIEMHRGYAVQWYALAALIAALAAWFQLRPALQRFARRPVR